MELECELASSAWELRRGRRQVRAVHRRRTSFNFRDAISGTVPTRPSHSRSVASDRSVAALTALLRSGVFSPSRLALLLGCASRPTCGWLCLRGSHQAPHDLLVDLSTILVSWVSPRLMRGRLCFLPSCTPRRAHSWLYTLCPRAPHAVPCSFLRARRVTARGCLLPVLCVPVVEAFTPSPFTLCQVVLTLT